MFQDQLSRRWFICEGVEGVIWTNWCLQYIEQHNKQIWSIDTTQFLTVCYVLCGICQALRNYTKTFRLKYLSQSTTLAAKAWSAEILDSGSILLAMDLFLRASWCIKKCRQRFERCLATEHYFHLYQIRLRCSILLVRECVILCIFY